MTSLDLVVSGGTAVLPGIGERRADIGVRDGRVAAIAEDLGDATASERVDARGRLVLPGAIDSHFHLGIYRPLADDVPSETASALVGGVTTILSYFRTGHHYLDRTGPYAEVFPLVLRATEGAAHTDYGYHLAIMTSQQVEEIPMLVREHGVGSFKFYMFYMGLDLAGTSTDANAYTMADRYDLGHLYRIMERVAALAAERRDEGRISLSIHCETPDIIRTFIDETKARGVGGLAGWDRARPPFSERMAIGQAALLAARAGCPVNVLHISSSEALEGARDASARHPWLDLRLEATLHHLTLTSDSDDIRGKVNPPIRPRADVDALWAAIADGRIGSVASDHACCPEALKGPDLWGAQPGFGGSALMYPVLLSEGHRKRGLPLARIAELAATEPARRFGLHPRKGAIAVGADADLAVVDPEREVTVTPQLLRSAQEYTPFAGMRLRGWVERTILRGETVHVDGRPAAAPRGRYLPRPVAAAELVGIPV